jgi:hypothetical protein
LLHCALLGFIKNYINTFTLLNTLACEGCKGFFKRAARDSLLSMRECVFGGKCEINIRTRNRCQYCRMQKCLGLGMSKEGIKLGRRSKKFKQNLDTALNISTSTSNNDKSIQESSSLYQEKLSDKRINSQLIPLKVDQNQSQISSLNLSNFTQPNQQIFAILQDNKIIIKTLDLLSNVNTSTPQIINLGIEGNNYKKNSVNNLIPLPTNMPNSNSQLFNSKIILKDANGSNLDLNNNNNLDQVVKLVKIDNNNNNPVILLNNNNINDSNLKTSDPQKLKSSLKIDNSQIKIIKDAVLQSFKETTNPFQFHKISPQNELNSTPIMSNLYLTNVLSKGFLSLLNETKFLDYVNNLIESSVLFAKNVPYFMNVHETDRINLLKSSVFEIIIIKHSHFFKPFIFKSSSSQINDGITLDLPNSFESVVLTSQNSTNTNNSLVTLAACALANYNCENEALNGENKKENVDKLVLPYFNCWTTCAWLSEKLPQLENFLHLLFDFYQFFTKINITENELALLSSYLLFNNGKFIFFNLFKVFNHNCWILPESDYQV